MFRPERMYVAILTIALLSMTAPVVIATGRVVPAGICRSMNRYAVALDRTGVFLAHFSVVDGAIRAGEEVSIAATEMAEQHPSIIAPPGRPLRAVYARIAPEPPYAGGHRIFMRDEIPPRRRMAGRR